MKIENEPKSWKGRGFQLESSITVTLVTKLDRNFGAYLAKWRISDEFRSATNK